MINILRDFIFKKYYKTSQISTKSASFYMLHSTIALYFTQGA